MQINKTLLLYLNAKYLLAISNIKVIFDWSGLINIQDVHDHADDTRLTGCIVAILYAIVSCVHILWLNRTSYVISRRPCCLFTSFEVTVKYTNFTLRYNKTNTGSNWRHQSLFETFSP